ncbi:exonuclease V subunit gamma [Lujinxingia vulgaris]|uniref:Exonuclease V subunit gamma n=1 Tax=Lujinxingia vulgaris TaxID=2600176 RepID=A0A5C6X6V9_9DELT|nr:exodeoxyribonuclease V subunit gamma [Lujinxingia vulgaris]TXD32079.1 exonuclease V subunit gamma [Lujinxingia vulgaris]
MLHVFQSDRVEDLVDGLVKQLEATSPTEPVARAFFEHRLVVPNANLKTYLSFEIASKRGVASGLRVETMETFLESLIPRDDQGEPVAQIAASATVERLLIELLSDEALLGAADMEPVRAFLMAAGQGDDAALQLERRRYQLARRLASLFREYGFSRRDMLDAWRAGECLVEDASTYAATERWQRRLWRALFLPGGALEQAAGEGPPLVALTDLMTRFTPDQLNMPEVVHLVGFSYLPPFFRDVFAPLWDDEVHQAAFYVLSPCLEAWGTVVMADDDPLMEASEESELMSGDELPLALTLWGGPGRDFHRMLLDLSEGDIQTIATRGDRPDDTLLQRLQRVIRDRADARQVREESEPIEELRSVRFLDCPSIQRECEIIASEIWELVTRRDDLRFNDIAVVVQPGQREMYQTHLRAAFEQTHGIPHNVIDIDASLSSPVLDAARQLFELPLGSFKRSELLKILVHPAVVATRHGADARQWARWCDELHIFHGADRSDHQNTYIRHDRYNWQQGLDRLVLGSFMTQPDATHARPMTLAGSPYLPLETGHGEAEQVAVFVELAQSLIVRSREVRDDRRPLGAWMAHFKAMISDFIGTQQRSDERALLRLHGELSRIARADRCPDAPVGYRTAYDFAMSALSSLEDSFGKYLADGVVVSSFKPMRPIPFEVVFVTGLGQGNFPAPTPPDSLDLREDKRRLSDVRPRDQDFYMFLETLMSTRAEMVLSWVGRDAQTGDRLEPASVVLALQEMAEALEGRERVQARVVRHPLRRYDAAYFPKILPADEGAATASLPNHHREALAEAVVRRNRLALDAKLPTGYRPSMVQLAEGARKKSEGSYDELVALTRWSEPHQEVDATERRRVVLQLRDLSRFLKCPLQGSARTRLRIYDEDTDDLIDAEDEPFEPDFLQRLMVMRATIHDALLAGDLSAAAVEAHLRRRAELEELRGAFPSDLYFEAAIESCLGQLGAWVEGIKAATGSEAPAVQRVRFGVPRSFGQVGLASDAAVTELDAIRLVVDDASQPDGELEVELHGEVMVLGDPKISVGFPAGGSPKGKHYTEGAIEQIALLAAGLAGDEPAVAALVSDAKKSKPVPLQVQDAAWALGYLKNLSAELVSGVHDYFLPVELVEEIIKKGGHHQDVAIEPLLETFDPESRYSKTPSTKYGPIKRWQDYEPPPLGTIQTIIENRYALMLKALGGK